MIKTTEEWPVKQRSLLMRMEKLGWITEPPEHVRPKPGRWGKDYHYVDDVGSNALDSGWRSGETLGLPQYEYCRRYFDGCFYPFVIERPITQSK